ncbi:MAG: hypothetical protein ACR2LL_10245 [Nitrosopumilus sp.]
MAKDVLVRGVDEKIYSSLGDAAKEKGISINSLVKDAIDSWLSKNDDVTKIHHLVLYADDKSMTSLLRSLDYFAKKSGWFKCHCGPATNSGVQLLDEMKWYNGTVIPYDPNSKNLSNYCGKVMQKIGTKANGQPVCCVDFIVGDIANEKSLSQAVKIEHEYNKNRIGGLMFCPYKTPDLLSAGIDDMIELFEEHDQIFVLKGDKVYKLHLTLESTHKMIMG